MKTTVRVGWMWVLLAGLTALGQQDRGEVRPAGVPPGMKVFPLREVTRGLRGVAYTVFEGVTPETMEVEILGVLKDAIGPGQDMILGRLGGAKATYTGVVAGMSGSPVYIGGRLVGAVSYRIGQFSKEPIAGITPIEQMFEVRDGAGIGAGLAGPRGINPTLGEGAKDGAPGVSGGGLGRATADPAIALRSAQDDRLLGGQGDGEINPTLSRSAKNGAPGIGDGALVQAMETPLVFSGFSQEAVDRFGGRFRALGMTPVAGLGGVDREAKQPEPLVPGSAVSAVLVRGDLNVAGTCTVTYVDKDQLLACGHPLTQYGRVSIPMTKTNVVATLASPLNAFKIVNATETVGAFTEDRASAIMGQFGAKARMIPVVVEVRSQGAEVSKQGYSSGNGETPIPYGDENRKSKDNSSEIKSRTLRFEVLDNRQLTPSTMLVSVYQALQGTNSSAAEISYRLSGEMTVAGLDGKALPPVRMDGEMAQNEFNPAAINAALFVGQRFAQVYQNAVEQPVITGLRLRVEAAGERKTAVIETARLGRMEARAGETVEVEATVRPYHAETRVVQMRLTIPAGTAAGPLRVMVSDGATLDRLLQPGGATTSQHPLALADMVAQMNREHANDRVYLTVLERTAQAVLPSGTMVGVPLSMANVLEPLKDGQEMRLTGESAVEAGSAEVAEAVTGSKVLTLMVR